MPIARFAAPQGKGMPEEKGLPRIWAVNLIAILYLKLFFFLSKT